MTPIPATLERALRSLPPDRLLQLADAIRRAALLLDRGQPDRALDELATAAEVLSPTGDRQRTPQELAIGLLDRVIYDLEQGWSAAAYDAAARATSLIESMTKESIRGSL